MYMPTTLHIKDLELVKALKQIKLNLNHKNLEETLTFLIGDYDKLVTKVFREYTPSSSG